MTTTSATQPHGAAAVTAPVIAKRLPLITLLLGLALAVGVHQQSRKPLPEQSPTAGYGAG